MINKNKWTRLPWLPDMIFWLVTSDMFNCVLSEIGSENLRICLKVIEEYILLGPMEFMKVSINWYFKPVEIGIFKFMYICICPVICCKSSRKNFRSVIFQIKKTRLLRLKQTWSLFKKKNCFFFYCKQNIISQWKFML